MSWTTHSRPCLITARSTAPYDCAVLFQRPARAGIERRVRLSLVCEQDRHVRLVVDHPDGGAPVRHDAPQVLQAGARDRARRVGCEYRLVDIVQHLELSEVATQLVLGAVALGDVAQDHRVEPASARLELGYRGLDRELLAVRPPAEDHAEGAHAPAGRAVRAERVHVVPVRRPESLRNEDVEGLPLCLRRGPAEHLFRRGVEFDDALRVVDGDDSVHRRADDAAQPGFAVEELPGERLLAHELPGEQHRESRGRPDEHEQ